MVISTKQLISKDYCYDNGYYVKSVRNKTTNEITTCYVSKNGKVSIIGVDKKYFLKELIDKQYLLDILGYNECVDKKYIFKTKHNLKFDKTTTIFIDRNGYITFEGDDDFRDDLLREINEELEL